jgi:hypothetical protein
MFILHVQVVIIPLLIFFFSFYSSMFVCNCPVAEQRFPAGCAYTDPWERGGGHPDPASRLQGLCVVAIWIHLSLLMYYGNFRKFRHFTARSDFIRTWMRGMSQVTLWYWKWYEKERMERIENLRSTSLIDACCSVQNVLGGVAYMPG